jgi:hypothetical protein
MICCDTCPYNPTCEEEDDFLRSIGLLPDDDDDPGAGYDYYDF